MDTIVGVGASKFLGVQGFLPKFSQTCPKCCRATFADRFCGVSSTPMVFTCFSANLGRHFSKSNKVGRHVAQIFRDFA